MAEHAVHVLLGREDELRELEADLDDAIAGRGGAVVIVGQAGIGKTRLADELATRAAARGATVAWGRCWEAGGAPAYWPFIEVLRALARAPGLEGIDQRIGAAIRSLTETSSPVHAVDPAQARFFLYDELASLLREAGSSRPLVIVLDDLHASDAASLGVLYFLLRSVRNARVLVVATYRDHERPAPDVADLIARITRESRFLRPASLSRDQIAQLVEGAAGREQWADAIHRATEGNPLFVVEYVRLAARGGGLPSDTIPGGVAQALRARIAAASPTLRARLELASVLGRDIDLGALAALTLASRAQLTSELAEAAALQLVDALEGERYRFSHILLREELYRALPAEARARAHSVLGTRATDPIERAHHAFGAAPVDGLDVAMDASIAAAAHALGRLAFEDAIALLSRALDALPGGVEHDRLRARLLLRLGEAEIRAGRLARGDDHCMRAAALATALADGTLIAEAALAYGAELRPGVILGRLIELLRDAERDLPAGDSPLRARVLARLAAALQPAPDPEQPIAMAREAIAMARRIGDPEVLLDALFFGGSAVANYGDPSERAALDRETADLALQRGMLAIRLRALGRLIFDHLELAERARAERVMAEHDALAGRLGRLDHACYALSFRSMLAILDGRFDDAEQTLARAEMLATGSEDSRLRPMLLLQRLGLLRAKWDREGLIELEPALRALGGQIDPVYPDLISCAVATRTEDPVRCAELGTRAVVDPRMLDEMDWVADVAARAGALDVLARLEALHVSRATRATICGFTSFVTSEPPARALAVAAAARGATEDADRWWSTAIACCRAIGGRAMLASILAEHAAHRAACGDRMGAERLAREAGSLASELGIRAIEERANALLGRSAAPAFTLDRDGDGFRLTTPAGARSLKATRGLEMIATLLARPGEEISATHLDGGEHATIDHGDAGEMLDRKAIAAYRARIAALRERIEHYEQIGDAERVAMRREELDAIARELARGTGLGGRARRAGSAVERARVNVQRRIRAAIEQIEAVDPAVGRYLGQAIRTGTACCFRGSARED